MPLYFILFRGNIGAQVVIWNQGETQLYCNFVAPMCLVFIPGHQCSFRPSHSIMSLCAAPIRCDHFLALRPFLSLFLCSILFELLDGKWTTGFDCSFP